MRLLLRSFSLFPFVFLSLFSFFVKVDGQTVKIHSGSFMMGGGNGDFDERPSHEVNIRSFSIDRFEVTNAQYQSCVSAGRCTPAHYNDGKCLIWTGKGFKPVNVPVQYRDSLFPAVCVTWRQAGEYCGFRGMRLPTEAEWEYAARSGGQSRYSWGDGAPSLSKCTMYGQGKLKRVESYSPNAFGLYDMTGNAWEWTSDYYQKDYYTVSPKDNPNGPDVGLYRVIRGGGWYSGADQLRCSNRQWFSPDYAEASIGFRCAGN